MFLDPPMIAKHVRLILKPVKKDICIQFELFGCIFTDGVVSYNMLQGSHRLEDDTYDGEYDEKQRYLYGKIASNFLSYFINLCLFKMVSVNYLMVRQDLITMKMNVDFNG